MLNTFFPVLVLLILAGGFVTTMLLLSVVLGPKSYSEMKDDPFECGTIGTGNPSDRMSVRFYLVAITFIVFDLEIIFLYPWAVKLVQFGWYGLWVMLPFLFILIVGLAYEWRRGVLNWN
jgi:NADH-quinone oxidoreductase subunit A